MISLDEFWVLNDQLVPMHVAIDGDGHINAGQAFGELLHLEGVRGGARTDP